MPIRVVTINVWALPDLLTKHRRERIDAIAKALPSLDADVVAVQEAWTDSARGQLLEGLKRAGYDHVWHHRKALGGSGLLLASRLELRDIHFEPFAARGFAERIQHMDYYSGKGFVRARVETSDGPVVVLATHLHANYAPPGVPDDYHGVRNAQAIQIAADLSKIEHPVIALGDFNIEATEDTYRLLRGLANLRDVALELDRPEPTSLRDNPYHAHDHVEERIDYVFRRPGRQLELRPTAIRRVLDDPLEFAGEDGAYSDHAGLAASFEIEARKPDTGTGRVADEVDADAGLRFEDAVRLGDRLIAAGRRFSEARRRDQRTVAGGAGLAAIAAAVGARNTKRSRRRFLSNTLGLGAAAGILWSVEQTWLSEWMHDTEIEGFDAAQRQLAELRDANRGGA